MRIPVVVWGFISDARYAIRHLEDNQVIEVVEWVCEDEPHPNAVNIFLFFSSKFLTNCPSRWWHYYMASAHHIHIMDEIRSYTSEFIEYYLRHDLYKNRETMYYDCQHLFELMLRMAIGLIITTQPHWVFFSNIPHEGFDIILYRVAKMMGVKTAIFHQTLFPNKLLVYESVEQFGGLSHWGGKDDASKPKVSIDIPNGFSHHPFYMAHIPKKYDKKAFWGGFFKAPLNQKHTYYLTHYDRLISSLQFQENLKKRVSSIPTVPFVYFPLHLQPELTTSALGGDFSDQVLAIERLASFIPSNWKIVLKENPKQSAYRRTPLFFERLDLLPSVTWVSPDTPTHLLIDQCEWVSTITGTAGWEALTGGKCVLIFGRAWYAMFPGVIRYHPAMSIDEFQPFSREEFVNAFDRWYHSLADGIIDDDYQCIHPGYTRNENTKHFVTIFQALLDSTPVAS